MSVSGATGSSYTLVSADVGSTMRVRVTASNSAGSALAQSAATGVCGRVFVEYVWATLPGSLTDTATVDLKEVSL